MGEYLEYLAFRLVSAIARRLSFHLVGRLGARLGASVFDFTRVRKDITIENIRKSFPHLTHDEVRKIARGAFRSYGRSICEMMWAGNKSDDVLKHAVHLVNRDVFDRAFAIGTGVILVSGHFGCWEMVAHGLPLNLGVPIIAIAQRQRNAMVDTFITQGRSRFGNSTVYMNESVRKVLRSLKSGGVVVMLGDQSAPKESVFVEFFGRPAATHRGAALFSLKTGAPIVMVFHIRRADGRYDAVFEAVDQSGLTEYSELNVIELTRRHTAILERYIRQYPDHWLWMHKRWKHTEYYQSMQSSKPPGEDNA